MNPLAKRNNIENIQDTPKDTTTPATKYKIKQCYAQLLKFYRDIRKEYLNNNVLNPVFINEFLIKNDITKEEIKYYIHKDVKLNKVYQKLKILCETSIIKAGINNKDKMVFCMFLLKTIYGYNDHEYLDNKNNDTKIAINVVLPSNNEIKEKLNVVLSNKNTKDSNNRDIIDNISSDTSDVVIIDSEKTNEGD